MRRILAVLALGVFLLVGASAWAGKKPQQVCYYVSVSFKGNVIVPEQKVCIPCPQLGCAWLPASEQNADQTTGVQLRRL